MTVKSLALKLLEMWLKDGETIESPPAKIKPYRLEKSTMSKSGGLGKALAFFMGASVGAGVGVVVGIAAGVVAAKKAPQLDEDIKQKISDKVSEGKQKATRISSAVKDASVVARDAFTKSISEQEERPDPEADE